MRRKIILSAALLLAFGLFSFFTPIEKYFQIAKNIEIFTAAFKEINYLYIEEVNPNNLIKKGIDNMLKSLDPYTNFIPENEVENYRTMNTGQYGGIGAITQILGKRIVISMLQEGYPAIKNGLRIGDEILQVDAVELSKISIGEAMQLMRGQVGSTIKITVKRIGQPNPLLLQFTRQKIKLDNVPYYDMLNENTGYIKLANFMPKASKEVKEAMVSLKKRNAKNMILDLRENRGGLLLEAIDICSLFLSKGSNIVTTKGKTKNSNTAYKTKGEPVDIDMPLVVLINKNSASASEIVAGSFQDYDRAVVMGERSFGKGLVQLNYPLPYNAQIKITTAKYYTPTGRCIQALDYTHRHQDGSVDSTPDSLKKEFKTSHGRSVYDGGGINPDIAMSTPLLNSFSQMLYQKGFILDYATLYAHKHSTIASAKKFRLTEKEYDAFKVWMQGNTYTYRSPTRKLLSILKKEAEEEQRFDELTQPFEQLSKAIEKDEKNRFSLSKYEIKAILEENIIAHYYFEKGLTETQLRRDSMVANAIRVLDDTLWYKKTLNIL